MIKTYQYTIKAPVDFKGIGLHSGKTANLRILPGEADKGIVFKRVDLKDKNFIPANFNNVCSTRLCTTLQNEFGVRVSTVEHLLAALYVSEIDNAVIEVNSEEVPIMDGSSKDFLNSIEKAGIKKLSKKRKYLKILEKIELKDEERNISIEPVDTSSLQVNFQLNYKNKIIGNQKNSINFQSDDLEDIINSRTFCLYEDIEKIKKLGLAKGGSLENAIVVDQNKVLNNGGLRNHKEFVNHKILDLVGDFFLSGFRVLGKVNCQQGGHELSTMFLRKLIKSTSSISIIEVENVLIPKKTRSNQPTKIAVNA